MTTSELINKVNTNHAELAGCIYDMGCFRNTATNAGYNVRKENIEKMRKLLDQLEELNEDLK